MFLSKLKKVAETVGLACFAFLAVYGAFSLIRGDMAQAAKSVAQDAPPEETQAASPQNATAADAATVPLVLNYQGTLRDMEGNPLSGYYTMTFRIYTDIIQEVTEAPWTEEHISVTVRAGQFNVLLGNINPIPENLFALPDRFIGVTVHPYDEMIPRRRFAAVPYAIHADNASRLAEPDGDDLNAVYVDNDGDVGIGMTGPQQRLDVQGDIQIRKTGHWSQLRFGAQTNDPGGIAHWEDNNAAKLWLYPSDDFDIGSTDDYIVLGDYNLNSFNLLNQ